MARRLVTSLLIVAGLLSAPAGAQAHGMCNCTTPLVAAPGDGIETGPAHRVVWNPAPRDFLGQPIPGDVTRALRADEPALRVVDGPLTHRPQRAGFRVPEDARPGTYVVLVLDGADRGRHTAWDFVRVSGSGSSAGAGGGDSPLLLVGALLFAAALGVALWRRSAAEPGVRP